MNIGAAARAMSNFGVRKLRVVNPYEIAFREAKSAMRGAPVLENAEEFGNLADAAVDLERLRIDRAICFDRVEEAVQVLRDSLDDWYSRVRGEQLRQAEHVLTAE